MHAGRPTVHLGRSNVPRRSSEIHRSPASTAQQSGSCLTTRTDQGGGGGGCCRPCRRLSVRCTPCHSLSAAGRPSVDPRLAAVGFRPGRNEGNALAEQFVDVELDHFLALKIRSTKWAQ